MVRNYAHSHHGTLKKSADELRPLTAMDGHYTGGGQQGVGGGGGGHVHKPSMDTLRRVHFEKTSVSPSSNNGITPASPPKISMQPVTTSGSGSTVITATTVGLLPPSSTVVTNSTSGGGHVGNSIPSLPVSNDNDEEEDEGDTAM